MVPTKRVFFERRKFHRNVFLPRDGGADNSSTGSKSSCIVGSSILWGKEWKKKEWWEWKGDVDETSDGRGKREEERGGSKKRKKHSKFKVSSHKSKAQPMTNHSTSYTPTHDPTVLTFMVPPSPCIPYLIVPQFYWWVDCWLIFVSRARGESSKGWVDGVGEDRQEDEKRCTSGPRVLLKSSRLFYVSFKRGAGRRAKFKSLSRRPTKPFKWQTFSWYICIRYVIKSIQNRRGAFIGT